MRGNNGFTLAEVLITLVIIGVIGALTVPALIQNTKKQEYVTALKKAYSTLSQAAQQIIAEEGSPNCSAGGWLCSIQDNFDMSKKYLNSAKECTSASGCFQHGIKYLNTGVWTTYQTGENYKRLILADGMQVLFDGINTSCAGDNPAVWGVKNYCAIIAVDINGEKAPNQMGRDLFYFIVKENGLYPAGCDYDTHDCVPGAETRGHGCACRVIRENAINY